MNLLKSPKKIVEYFIYLTIFGKGSPPQYKRLPKVKFLYFLLHHPAKTEPVTFIIGPNKAGAIPTVAILPIATAKPDAKPAFCKPTSIETVRQSCSLKPKSFAPQ